MPWPLRESAGTTRAACSSCDSLAVGLDRFPDLPILLGHWGEVVLFYLDRLDSFAARANLPLSFSEYARRHVYATAGGLYSERYLNWAADVLGVERLLFGSDYPYRPGPDDGVAGYLARSGLNLQDQARVASGNGRPWWPRPDADWSQRHVPPRRSPVVSRSQRSGDRP